MPDLQKLENYLTPERRRALYKVAVALGALLVVQKVLSADDVASWLGVLAAVLGTAAPAVAHRNVLA